LSLTINQRRSAKLPVQPGTLKTNGKEDMLKVLFLCTENACRSQMAEGLVNHDLDGLVKAFSAGIQPSQVNPRAIQVMNELGIDIRHHRSKSVDDLAGEQFDLVITVCDNAAEQCPMFPGNAEILHISFPDPAQATGTEEEIMAAFRRVRDDLREQLIPLLRERLKQLQSAGSLG
jgi:arsenate reductase (thioredoxin)